MHPVFLNRTFTPQEIADGTAKSITEFKRQYPQFYPCEANAEMLMDFIFSQLGSNEGENPEYPYPYLFENFQFAYHLILDSGRWFYSAPETPQQEQARLAREQAQARNAEVEEQNIRRGTANLISAINEQVHVLKELPISQLRTIVANERPSSPNGKKYQPETQPGVESRPVGMSPASASKPVPAKIMQAARRQVSLDNPTLPRDGVKFNSLLHEYLQKRNS